MEQPQKMPAKEKGSEANRVRALGRKRASLDHTPENTDSARCRGSLVIFVYGDPRIWRGLLGVLSELLSTVIVS